jgi:hypothetical protein
VFKYQARISKTSTAKIHPNFWGDLKPFAVGFKHG